MPVLSSPKTGPTTSKHCLEDGPAAGSSSRVGRFLNNHLRQVLFRKLAHLDQGRLTLVEGDEKHEFGTPTAGEPDIEVFFHTARVYRQLILGGSLGAAESYIRGDWDCENLVDLMRLLCRNPSANGSLEGGPSRLFGPIRAMAHRWRRNTLGGSRRNIATHYDLGEDFFSLFLDGTMAYSCGIFATPQTTLQDASRAKFDRVCHRLELAESDHVLEIGSGWGGFAVYAARTYGCRVTATTLSTRQYEFTLRRIEEERLADRVTVLNQDYRKLTGQFDKIASLEMIEAVGHKYFDTYFRACSNLLSPQGMMLLQAITIPDQRFERYRRSVDFIQRYVFPGGCLPSLGAICGSVGRATDLLPVHLEDLTAHYVRTLRHWRDRFRKNLDKVRALDFSEEFIRLWEFYFAYCEAAFHERMIGDIQLLLQKPGCRRGEGEP